MTFAKLMPAQTAALSVPSQTERHGMLSLERTEANQQAAIDALACLNRVEAPVSTKVSAPLRFPFTALAWNMERCHFLEPSKALIAEQHADLALLTEMDDGMSRTGQHHTTRAIADHVGMAYAYGVEFLELELGTGIMLPYCRDPQNDKGFHGNAILARTPLQAPTLLRLPDQMFWFADPSKSLRVGTRCAVLAAIATEAGPICVVSVHLENLGDSQHRYRQMLAILDAIDDAYGEMPVLLGGDLNTGLADDGDYTKEELFDLVRNRGFLLHSGDGVEMTTRPSRFSADPSKPRRKLDWFFTRGLAISQSRVVPALAADGAVLSDHDMIRIQVDGFAPA